MLLATAQATDGEHTGPPIAFRRIFVPADDVAAWPREGERYLPVEAKDFDAWLAAANRPATAELLAATIAQAVYTARLENGQLVDGRGEWTIAVRGGKPAFLPLGDMSLVVREPRWRDDPAANVRLGAWGPSRGAAETLGLEVARSDVLEFLWRLPAPIAGENVVLPWRLPLASVSRLVLDLPADKSPVWEGSVLLSSNHVPDRPAGWKRWVLAAGPGAQQVLRIADAPTGPAVKTPTVSVREELSYHIGERGLEFESRLQLEGPLGERRQLAIAVPSGVQLVSATENGQELTWRLAGGGANSSPRTLIELADRPDGQTTTIVLRGWQPLVTEKPWSLPKLRPDDAYWTAGSIQMSISPLVELESLVPSDCLQTSAQLAGAEGTTPESVSFTAYSPTANVEVVVGSHDPEAKVSVGTTLDVGNADVTGRSVTQLTVARGSVHTLFGELPTGWVVDAAETVPSDALGEWYVDERDGRRQLEVQLSGAARPDRPVTVAIAGRLQVRKLDDPIPAETLQLVRWTGVNVVRDLLSVQASEPYVVEPLGGWKPLATATLTEEDQARLLAGNEGLIFDFADAANEAALQRVQKRGQYSAEIWLDATLADDELRRSYHLTCRPQASRVDQLLVYASAPLGDEIRWTEKTTSVPLTAERLPADDPRLAGLPTGGELWQLRLPRPQAKSVEIDATIVSPWLSRRLVPILSMPEATEQRGRVLIRIAGGHPPDLELQGHFPIPLPNEWNDAPQTADLPRVWAAYRYEPADLAASAREPHLWLEPDVKGAAVSPVVARLLDFESYFSASGDAVHRVTYHVENQGAESFQLRLPEGAQLTALDVDGHAHQPPAAAANAESLTIRLSSARLATITLRLTTKQSPLMPGSRLQPPLPVGSIPLLASSWTIWLPAEFAALGMDAEDLDDGYSWRRRLFGPLARPIGALPFDPFRRGAWAGLVSRLADEAPVGDAAPTKIPDGPERGGATIMGEAGKATNKNPAESITVAQQGAETAHELEGWRAYRRSFVAGSPASAVVAHPPASTAWAVALFLMCVFSGRRAFQRSRVLFIVLTALTATLALVLTAAFAPLATGAFLGLLCSLGVPRRWDVERSDAPTRTWNRQFAVGVTATVLAIGLASWAAAQSASSETSNDGVAASDIHRVLIPADAAGHPVGTKVYLSDAFLRQLLPYDAGQTAGGGAWFLRDARYHGKLRQLPDDAELTVGEWTMLLDVEVMSRDTMIVLPLVHDEAAWPQTALVDGIPQPLTWRDEGRSCSMQIAEPGRYEIAIDFSPRTPGIAGPSQIELTLPSFMGARIELRHPLGVSGLSIEGGVLKAGDSNENGLLHGELDDSGRLVVRWPRREATNAAQDQRVTELRWLRITPAGVELTVKYLASQDSRLAQSLSITADRRWQLVGIEDSPAELKAEVESLELQTVRVELPPDDAERGEATLRWRLDKPSSLGRLRLPKMELTGTPAGQCWIAVSSDPALDCEFVDANGLIAETADEFITLWGATGDGDRPRLVVGNVSPDSDLSLAVRPETAESLVDELLYVAAGADALRVQYQADVVPGDALRYSFPVTVPADLSVDQIAITHSGQSVPHRWARLSPSRVNVFLGEEMDESYRLILNGHVPTRDTGEIALPHVATAAQDLAVQRVQVYRNESVTVELLGPANVDDAAPDLPPTGWKGRLVGAYQLESDVIDQVRVAVKPNIVQTVGETLTTLSHSQDLWWATFNCQFSVQQGELDTLRLRVPATWVGPFEVEPAAASVVVAPAVDGGHAFLSIRFPTAIQVGKSVALKVHGPLALAAGSQVAVPLIESEPRSRWQSYLVVPTSVESQAVAWTVEGAQPAALPKILKPALPSTAPEKTFRVATRTFRVAIATPATTEPTASVRLADTNVVRGPAGSQLIATRFVIAPQGLTECELELPSSPDGLVSATLDGQPARIRRNESGSWKVQFVSSQLPQMLDVVWEPNGDAQRPFASSIALRRPTLHSDGRPIPVEMSLWSFGQRRIGEEPRVEGARQVTDLEQAALRLDRLVSIAETATPTAAGMPLPDGYYWFCPWAEQLAAAQEAARVRLAASGREGTASQVSPPAEEQVMRAADRIAKWIDRSYEVLGWPDLGPRLERPTEADERRGLPSLGDGHEDWIYCVEAGGADQIVVEWNSSDVSPSESRLAGLLAIACVVAVAIWFVRQSAASDLFCRWPHAATVLVGLVWWAWLWPSWLGLVIVAASLFFLFGPVWHSRSLGMEGSTVLQPGRPL